MSSKTSSNDSTSGSALDVKSLVLKVFSYWKLFVITTIIGLSAAKFKNGYEEKSYSINTTISVEEEQNPLFSSSTNIAFNWGGASNMVETIKARFRSRTHNEKVVSQLRFYIDYLEEGKYRMEDVYGRVPFILDIDSTHYQLQYQLIKVQFIKNNKVTIEVDFENPESTRRLTEYATFKSIQYTPSSEKYEKTFDIDSVIKTPFSTFKLSKKHPFETSKVYYIKFNNINATVARYRNIKISDFREGTSLLRLSLSGSNKSRLVDYLNTSVQVLGNDQKRNKIAYAEKTKNYIDTFVQNEADRLQSLEKKITKFKDSANLYSIESEGERIFTKIIQIDEELLIKNRSIDYIRDLRNYLLSHDQNTKDIPAPTINEINEPTTISNTQELITLVTLKNELEDAGVTAIHPEMIDIRNRIKSRKKLFLKT